MKKLKEGVDTPINCIRCAGVIMTVNEPRVFQMGLKCSHCGLMQIVKIDKQYVIGIEKGN